MKVHRAVLPALVLLIAAAGVALAGDSGTLIVKVVDESSLPFPGVAVAVENTTLLTALQAKQTDANGSASFILPAGSGYKVSVTAPDYNPDSVSDLKLSLNGTKQLLFTLKKKLTEHVVVHAAPATSVDEGSGATNPTSSSRLPSGRLEKYSSDSCAAILSTRPSMRIWRSSGSHQNRALACGFSASSRALRLR